MLPPDASIAAVAMMYYHLHRHFFYDNTAAIDATAGVMLQLGEILS